MNDFLVCNGGVVAQSLKMLFVGRFKILFSLRDFSHLIRRLAILEGTVRYKALLVIRISAIVRGTIELSRHANKIIGFVKSPSFQSASLLIHSSQQIYHPMNYNELTFHKANPFYKQDFMPDRAWFNRKAKDYPSQMPSGKDYFVDNGRKHFTNRFNHSEIENENILKSPQRYPFENRIAMDKTYMRSLHTIDIQGASSNTRVNQSIKNKYKAQDDLARRYNQSVDMGKPKEKTEQEKRREVALRQYQEHQERKMNKQISNSRALEASQISAKSSNPEYPENPTLKNQLSDEYKRYVMQNSNNKWNKDMPRPQQQPRAQERSDSSQSPSYQTLDPDLRRYNSLSSEQRQIYEPPRYEKTISQSKNESKMYQNEPVKANPGVVNPAPTPPSHYQYQFNGDRLKYNEEYQRILKYEQMSRQIMQNPRDFRKNSPTNLSLSFNLAGQNIVSS